MAKILNVFNKINSLRERYYKAAIGKEALLKIIAGSENIIRRLALDYRD